jgi:predicted methyltransferase
MKRSCNDKKLAIQRFIDGEKQLHPELLRFEKLLKSEDVDCYSNYLRAYVLDDYNEMVKQKQLILKEYKRPKMKKQYESKSK